MEIKKVNKVKDRMDNRKKREKEGKEGGGGETSKLSIHIFIQTQLVTSLLLKFLSIALTY